MQEILDKLFSSVWLMTIFIMVEMFFFIWLSFKNPFKKQVYNRLYKGLMFVIPCAIMLLPTFLYYGVADDFKKISLGSNTICLFEQYERGGGESADETVCRLHILNKKTGEKLSRNYIGSSGDIIGQKGDSVCYRYNKTICLKNAYTGETIYEIDIEDWENNFAELSAGVETVEDNQNYSSPRIPYIRLVLKDGNTLWFDPFSKKVLAHEPKNQVRSMIFSTGYDLKLQPKTGYEKSLLSAEYTEGTKRKKLKIHYTGKQEVDKLTSETFLDPVLLGIDTVQHVFVFAHYTTTQKNDFTVEAKDYSLKNCWKKTKAQLDVDDGYISEWPFSVYVTEPNTLYFNIGGYVISMDSKTGKIHWKTRN